jgi:hypothetical protein
VSVVIEQTAADAVPGRSKKKLAKTKRELIRYELRMDKV